METTYKILIPTDFSSVATTAINHGKKMATIMNGHIIVLHVVEKESQVQAVLAKLKPIVEGIRESGITAEAKVAVGDFIKQIPIVAEAMDVQLIIMGTHGRKGIQHLVGSYAMKVITASVIPFIVVQDKRVPESYKNIVFPIDLSAETKLKLDMTAAMAKRLGSTVHIFGNKEDDPFTKKQLEANIAYAKKFFAQQKVPFEVAISGEDGDFSKHCIHYAVSVDADLIAIINLNYRTLNPMFKQNEEELITNEAQIPVLTVNPTKDFTELNPMYNYRTL
ncbi:MAG: universal stress protein [Bacteroidetes bacterium]|nr:universal stress protein [Bacteroidota bacterium]